MSETEVIENETTDVVEDETVVEEKSITVGDLLTKYIEGDVYMYDVETSALVAQIPSGSPLFTLDSIKDLEIESIAAAKTSSKPRIKVFVKFEKEEV